MNKSLFSSDRDDWETPSYLFDELNSEFHFTLDPCCSFNNRKCEKYYTKNDNGLVQDWNGEVVFCNPPYGRNIKDWVKKAFEERFNSVIVMLLPARTDTSWFHDYILGVAEIRFLRGRIKFLINGVARSDAPFPCMVVIYNG